MDTYELCTGFRSVEMCFECPMSHFDDEGGLHCGYTHDEPDEEEFGDEYLAELREPWGHEENW